MGDIPQADQNVGHGHVWERPDGLKARCGGPGLCLECAADQMRLREAEIFKRTLDIALLIRSRDDWAKRARDAEERIRAALSPDAGKTEGETG